MNAFSIIGIAITIGGLLFAANKASPLLTLVLFWTAVVVLIVINIVGRRRGAALSSHKVDDSKHTVRTFPIKVGGAIVAIILCIYFHIPIGYGVGGFIAFALIVDYFAKRSAAPAKAFQSGKVDYAKLGTMNFVGYAPWLKENLRGHDGEIDEI